MPSVKSSPRLRSYLARRGQHRDLRQSVAKSGIPRKRGGGRRNPAGKPSVFRYSSSFYPLKLSSKQGAYASYLPRTASVVLWPFRFEEMVAASTPAAASSMAARKARRKFLRFFSGGFYDQKYIDWECGYKWAAHQAWDHTLSQQEYRRLLRGHEFQEIATLAVALEARANLLFSF
jgi:hypothetical protein